MMPQLLLKIRSIRSKNLRNFLEIYFYTYLAPDKRLTESHLRTPKIAPGLRGIQSFLGCSKATAQDYLGAVYVTRQFFALTFREQEKAVEKVAKEKLPNHGTAPLVHAIKKAMSEKKPIILEQPIDVTLEKKRKRALKRKAESISPTKRLISE